MPSHTFARGRLGWLSPEGITTLVHMPAARRCTTATKTGALRPRSAERSEIVKADFWQWLDHSFIGRHPAAAAPCRQDGVPSPAHPPPKLGQHNQEILTKWLGFSTTQLPGSNVSASMAHVRNRN